MFLNNKLILIISIFLYSYTFSQISEIDSLKLGLAKTNNLQNKIDLYSQLGLSYRTVNLDSAIYFHEIAANLSKQIHDELNTTKNLGLLGMDYNFKGDQQKALELLSKAVKIGQKLQQNRGKKEKKLNKILSSCYGDLGSVYLSYGNYSKALEYLFYAMKIDEELGDKMGLSTLYGNIGIVYASKREFEKARDFFNKQLMIAKELNILGDQSIALGNIGATYNDEQLFSKALFYHHEALKIELKTNNIYGQAQRFVNIAILYNYLGDSLRKMGGEKKAIKDFYNKAIDYCEKALSLSNKTGDQFNKVISLSLLGTIYINKDELSKADFHLKKALELAHKLESLEDIKQCYEDYYHFYLKKGDYRRALKSHEMYVLFRDSLNNEENTKALILKETKYEYEKQAAADSIKNAEEQKVKDSQLKLQSVLLKQEKTQRYALYAGLILVIGFLIFVYNRFKVTQKQKRIIEVKEKETQYQKHIIEEKHKEITDSINYAERIQRSFLATKEHLDANINDYFILFKPKDIVSGDFYWSSTLKNGCFILVTADSTGHGVPGAIMSLLNITSLEKAIETLTEPAEILNSTRRTIIERLKRDGSEEGGKDGMDASLLVFDFENSKVHIAAANNPVWIIRSSKDSTTKELIEIKADKMPVGKHDKDNISFTQHTIDLQVGDVVYAITDGYPDQFGGKLGKKFMSKNLKELLRTNSHLPMHEQKELLDITFKNWVGDLEQVDDVTLIGIRI